MQAQNSNEDRILTVPNLISALRLACVPWFLWLLFGAEDRWGAALLWGALGATDWVDGWWARRFNSVSNVGKLLDPITDRGVLLAGVFAVGFDGSVPWWLVALTLAREGLVAIVGLVLLSLGAKPIDVTWWGKCATFGLYFCFPLLLAGASDIGSGSPTASGGGGLGVRGAVARLQLPLRAAVHPSGTRVPAPGKSRPGEEAVSSRWGIWFEPTQPVRRLVELAQLAESLGAEACFVADEGTERDVYVALTAIVQATGLTVAPAITNPFSRHPVATAAAIATLAELAPGRVMHGLGVGGSRLLEPLGMDPKRPYTALRETFELNRRLLAGETVGAASLPWFQPDKPVPMAVAGTGPKSSAPRG